MNDHVLASIARKAIVSPWAWGYRFAVRSSKLTGDGYGRQRTYPRVLSFSSPCLLAESVRHESDPRRPRCMHDRIPSFVCIPHANNLINPTGGDLIGPASFGPILHSYDLATMRLRISCPCTSRIAARASASITFGPSLFSSGSRRSLASIACKITPRHHFAIRQECASSRSVR
jgi:hypothetical protein